MGKKATDERDYRKEISRLRKRVAYLEVRLQDLESIGLDLDYLEVVQDLREVEEKVDTVQPVVNEGLQLLKSLKAKRMKEICE
jgi:fatty acid-binding protein DegV